MTSIDKLSIRGIRSFSPNDAQVIEFFKPLTLIVGKNGSGKTTIIECLKMVTTGDLPPNCRGGQAFVNDPNALGTSEVKAQIKLKFTSANKKPALCNRSFSLTQKPQKREYKAFEAALQTLDDHNSKQCLSYKPSDLNRLVPEMMGVSHAVLESVIFVHQEDSCWPLAEDKVLKQRFDDIFAATEYTKALDNLKAYKNEKSKEIRVLAAELETCETKLKNVYRLRTELDNAKKTLKDLEGSIETETQRTHEAREKLPRLRMKLDERDRIRNELQQAVNDHHHALEASTASLEMLRKNFENCELAESDEELQELEAYQASQVVQLSAELDALKSRVAEVESEIERAEVLRDKQRGLFEQERAQEVHHKKLEAEALSVIDQLDREYTLVLSAGTQAAQTAAQRAAHAGDALGRVLLARQAELTRAKEERQATGTNLGAKVQKLRVELEHTNEAAVAKEREASSQEAKMRSLQERADGSDGPVDETLLARLKQEARDLKSQADAAREDLESCDLASDIADCKNRRRTAKDKISACNEELTVIEREGDRRERLRRQEEAVEEKRRKLQHAISERRSKLAAVLDVATDEDLQRMLDLETLSREVIRKRQAREETVGEKEHELKTAEERAQKKAQEVFVKQEAIRGLDQQATEAETALRAVNTLMTSDTYQWEARQAALDGLVTKKEGEKVEGKGVLTFFERGKRKLDDPNACCLMCNQTLGSDAKEYVTLKYTQLRDKVARSSDEECERQLERAKDDSRKHRRAHEQYEVFKRQRLEELPAAQETLSTLKEQQLALKATVDRLKAEAKALREAERHASEAMRDVDFLRFHWKELQSAQGEMAHTSSGMQSGMHTCIRPKEQVIDDRDAAQKELDTLERQIEEKGATLEAKRNELAETRARASAKELEHSRAAAAKERKQEQEQQLADMRNRLTQLRAEAKALREGERPKREHLGVMEGNLLGEEQRLDALIRDHDARVSQCASDHARLAEFARRLAQGSSPQRAQLMADLESRAREAEKTVAEKKALLREKHTARDAKHVLIQEQDKLTMQMRANLQYRELVAKERSLRAKRDSVEQNLQTVDQTASEANREYKTAQNVITESEMQKAKLIGSKDTVAENIKTLRTQLGERQYKNIDAEHREKLIEHKTVQMAVDDLNKYYKALNAALMRFHETKMADINKSITELWNKTYKGSDIDGISIKTEDEGQTADGRRKQSYRVVMRKGDATLDMRGRCSAGQKVLACLVIRLALAETFCINCGILALDEPTTNLDAANIHSLAEAINEIIKSRRQQANFQLLVITHDEEFVKNIGRSENASHYFHVEKRFLKEGDPPASTITKMEMHTFG